ncbi:MAG: hypothetical protein P8I52_04760 [Flavobacteriales bacterium]|nr:hypothetical protein [Flavobacteriales bacterium]MDG1934181.1 hypothetical protein [Flavobacteriales bacterium]|tara:strand:- start:1201 stop:2064 length:864 start_codon:yes stop_codon:yes gene_type:complete
MIKTIDLLHAKIFSEKNIKNFEKLILYFAVAGFLIHLFLVFLNLKYEINYFVGLDNLLSNPISALYTPFSFILVYEAFLLIFYFPRSFTTSIAKEYEIISLVLIRKIFEDIPKLDIESGIYNQQSLLLLYDLIAIIIIFYLIFLFKKTISTIPKRKVNSNLVRFISYKKTLSIILLPILLILCFSNLFDWTYSVFINNEIIKNIHAVFFIDFFTVLILVDVFILLLSFQYTDKYHQIIRNTGFIISTILLRLSFSVSGLSSVLLLIVGVIFGLIILRIYRLSELNSD